MPFCLLTFFTLYLFAFVLNICFQYSNFIIFASKCHVFFSAFFSLCIRSYSGSLLSLSFSLVQPRRFDDFERNLSALRVLPITYSCFHKNMEEYLAKYLFRSEKKIQHFNLDLSASPVSPTGALYTSQHRGNVATFWVFTEERQNSQYGSNLSNADESDTTHIT